MGTVIAEKALKSVILTLSLIRPEQFTFGWRVLEELEYAIWDEVLPRLLEVLGTEAQLLALVRLNVIQRHSAWIQDDSTATFDEALWDGLRQGCEGRGVELYSGDTGVEDSDDEGSQVDSRRWCEGLSETVLGNSLFSQCFDQE